MAAEKQAAARRAVEYVADGMALGLGSGTTMQHVLDALGARVRTGLRVVGVPTSETTAARARALGIPLATLAERPDLDLALDGADEIDPRLDLVKGRGGSLLREKVVATAARRLVIVADATKLVPMLGARAPVPVEVVPFAAAWCALRLARRGLRPTLRGGAAQPFVTDNGNWILDCTFEPTPDATALAAAIRALPGVVEHGFFLGMADTAVVAYTDGRIEVRQRA
ncbi:MAG TPA: ribose-5-phosphate isomerase RpiA [Chloroflexota bacterium]|nr:ribose-5-phosphate isomerase RpiA [Chloroflexota bacterium]